MTRPKILVTMSVPEAVKSALSEFGEIDIDEGVEPIARAELLKRIRDKDILISMLSDTIDKERIDAGSNLKIIGNYGVGYNTVDVAYANQKGIKVLNTPGALTETTADLTWALILAVARRVVEGDRFTRAGRFKGWAPTLMTGHDVYGKTLGIFGMGRVGQAVARRAAGFDMNILYNKRNRLDPETEKGLNANYTDLDNLLKNSDYVVLLAPLTDETRHIVDESKLSLMKPDAFLINVGRGPLVDEKVLLKFLKEKRIAGAAFDVYENEPLLTPGLSELDNVVLLPHVGSATIETRTKMGMMLVRGIKDILEGKRPGNLVIL